MAMLQRRSGDKIIFILSVTRGKKERKRRPKGKQQKSFYGNLSSEEEEVKTSSDPRMGNQRSQSGYPDTKSFPANKWAGVGGG